MERNRHSQSAVALEGMTALRAGQGKRSHQECAFGLVCCLAGSLGMHFDGGRQNLPAEEKVAFSGGQGLKVEFDRLLDVGDGLLKSIALRLASPQFGTPCVKAMLVLLDDDGRLAGHEFSVSLSRP